MPEDKPSPQAGKLGKDQAGSPRWSRLEQPCVPGMATFEWDLVKGTCWYSEEWENIVQCAYDWTIPNNREWWVTRVYPEDMALIERALLPILAGFSDRYEMTYRIRRPDGSWRLLFNRCKMTKRTDTGSPWIFSGVCIDLTEMFPSLVPEGGEIPRTASLSDLDYHSMLENSPDLFIRFDKSLEPVYENPSVKRFLGGARAGSAHDGARMSGSLSGAHREAFGKNVSRVFAERTVVRDEVILSAAHNKEAVGECSFWPEFDEAGNVRYTMLQFRDISDKRLAEQRAKLNEERLEALYRLTLMENAPESEVLQFVMDSVLHFTRSKSGFFFIPESEGSDRGYLLWSNDHFEEYEKRYFPQDHLPEDLITHMTGPDGERVYRSINNSKDGFPLCVLYGGRMKVMRWIVAPGIEGNRMACVAGVCNKSSEYDEADLQQLETFINSAWLILRRRRFVRELQQAKDAAEAANKAKNAFLANVSHELRTPLNGVLSMLQLIDCLSLAPEQREYLETAQTSGKALLRIISDILDYSCMESGNMPLAIEPFDFQTTVLSALNMFAEDSAAKGLEFLHHIDPNIPRCLLGDEDRVRQILFNVVGNALKFTSRGGITVSCSRVPGTPPDKAGIAIVVEDTGIGIPREKLDGIFDAFSRVESSHRRKYAGTGLGLSIVKHLATMMRGSVSASSEPGAGTAIRTVLYFDMPSSPSAEVAGVKPSPLAVAGEPLHILVAEDDLVGSMAIRAFLERRGHRVLCVDDGRKALEALQVYPFDCLFTDITMPRMDGLEMVQRLRSADLAGNEPSEDIRNRIFEMFPDASGHALFNSGTTVIAVSAHSMIGDRERFIEQGMDYYISKPIDKGEVDEALAFVVRRLARK